MTAKLPNDRYLFMFREVFALNLTQRRRVRREGFEDGFPFHAQIINNPQVRRFKGEKRDHETACSLLCFLLIVCCLSRGLVLLLLRNGTEYTILFAAGARMRFLYQTTI